MEDIVLHHLGTFDVVAEPDALGAQLTAQLRTARHHQLLICDKTLVNVVAYAQMLLPDDDRAVLDAMTHLCHATAPMYDAVFYTDDTFDPHQKGDRFRGKSPTGSTSWTNCYAPTWQPRATNRSPSPPG